MGTAFLWWQIPEILLWKPLLLWRERERESDTHLSIHKSLGGRGGEGGEKRGEKMKPSSPTQLTHKHFSPSSKENPKRKSFFSHSSSPLLSPSPPPPFHYKTWPWFVAKVLSGQRSYREGSHEKKKKKKKKYLLSLSVLAATSGFLPFLCGLFLPFKRLS